MYISKTITRSDGSKYVEVTRSDGSTYESAFWQAEPQEWTKEQEQMQRAIDEFGTSS